jgi:MerR family transcriptional regulator, light-induced transcriptional regulator
VPKVHGFLRSLRGGVGASITKADAWNLNRRWIAPAMSGIRTNAAAAMLGISSNTLRSWERRYSFPSPVRSPGGHRLYALTEIESLRQTLAETHNVSSAISLARERGEGPSSSVRLAAAFAAFDEEKANRLLEESLAVRSLERTTEEVLLDALVSHSQSDPPTAEYEFGWRHATGWLSALKRISPPASRPEGIMLFDASAPLDLDALHSQALELILRRAGVRTISLSPAIDPTRLGRALRAVPPAAVVLTGRRMSLDAIGRFVYAVRGAVHEIVVFDYRGAVPDTGASTVTRLGEKPTVARDRLMAQLDKAAAGTPKTAAGQRTAFSTRHR